MSRRLRSGFFGFIRGPSGRHAEEGADSRRHSHRERPPEGHPKGTGRNGGAAGLGRGRAESRQEDKRYASNVWDQRLFGNESDCRDGHRSAERERDGRREGCLERPRLQVWGDTELIANMRAECVLLHELPGDLLRETRAQAASAINSRKFCTLAHLVFRKLAALDVSVRFLRVALRAYGNILASGHRHGACDESCDARYEDCAMGHIRGGDTDHETRRGQDPVVRTEHGCTEPADSVGIMPFGMTRKALHGALTIADPPPWHAPCE